MLHRTAPSLLMLFILASGSQSLRADDGEGLQNVEIGLGTKHWLELQRSGFIASQHRQTVSGPVASEIYQRYVESFKHPIPDLYKSERKSSGGGR